MNLIYSKPTEKILLLTPEVAKMFLTHNSKKNRKVRLSKVSDYSNDMKGNRWVPEVSFYNDSILFNTHGEMINGQHRCWACIDSGVSIMFKVIFGIDDSNGRVFKAIDSGCRRTASDTVKVPNANSVASIAKVVVALREGDTPVMSSLQGKISKNKGVSTHVTKSQVIEEIEKNLDYLETVHAQGAALSRSFGRSRGTFCDIIALINCVGRGDLVESFVSDFSSDAPQNSTIAACKSYMTKCFCSTTFDTSPRWLVGTLLAAYENYRSGTATSVFNKGEIYITRYDKYLSEIRKGKNNG